MDSFEWNKIIGAVLATALFVVALNIVVPGFMKPHKPEKPGMEVAVTETTTTGEAPVAEAAPDWGTVIPVADVAAGEKVAQRCLQCHDFAKGGPNKIGPNLFGILGANHAHAPGFTYSAAMMALKDKTWGYDEFDAFMKNPKAAIPGTKMAFAGLSKQTDRVNLVAYLRTLADSPLALPAPKPAAPATLPSDGEPTGEPTTAPPGTEPTPAAPGEAAPATPGAAPPAGAATAPATPAPAAPAATTPAAPAKPPGH